MSLLFSYICRKLQDKNLLTPMTTTTTTEATVSDKVLLTASTAENNLLIPSLDQRRETENQRTETVGM